MQAPLIIAGLGNPGSKYASTRHNAGFMVVDELARQFGPLNWKTRWEGLVSAATQIADNEVVFIKPQTFMNLSGKTVQPALKFFQCDLQNCLIVYDEIELAFGDIRLKEGGGHKGHNGLRDLKSRLNSGDFWRLRFGVGRPENPHISVADHVLSPFSKTEAQELPQLIQKASQEVESWIKSRSQ